MQILHRQSMVSHKPLAEYQNTRNYLNEVADRGSLVHLGNKKDHLCKMNSVAKHFQIFIEIRGFCALLLAKLIGITAGSF